MQTFSMTYNTHGHTLTNNGIPINISHFWYSLNLYITRAKFQQCKRKCKTWRRTMKAISRQS